MPSSLAPPPDPQIPGYSWNPIVPTPSHPQRSGYSWNPIIIALVGAICVAFLFLSYYKIVGRNFFVLNGISLLGDRGRGRLLNEANQDESSLQFQSRGLESTILRALPVIRFRKTHSELGQQGENDCAVCLGEFEEGELLRLLPSCAHVFHISCIDTWFQSHSNCPLCRSNVIHSFSNPHGFSLSVFSLLETLRREDVNRERLVGYHVLGFENMQSPGIWCTPIHRDLLGSAQEPVEIVNDHQNMCSQHRQEHSLTESPPSRDGLDRNQNNLD